MHSHSHCITFCTLICIRKRRRNQMKMSNSIKNARKLQHISYLTWTDLTETYHQTMTFYISVLFSTPFPLLSFPTYVPISVCVSLSLRPIIFIFWILSLSFSPSVMMREKMQSGSVLYCMVLYVVQLANCEYSNSFMQFTESKINPDRNSCV